MKLLFKFETQVNQTQMEIKFDEINFETRCVCQRMGRYILTNTEFRIEQVDGAQKREV